jgi:hypothetical protein
VKRDDLLCLARLAVQIARTQMSDYANKFAPKRFTQPSLLACLCLKEFPDSIGFSGKTSPY